MLVADQFGNGLLDGNEIPNTNVEFKLFKIKNCISFLLQFTLLALCGAGGVWGRYIEPVSVPIRVFFFRTPFLFN